MVKLMIYSLYEIESIVMVLLLLALFPPCERLGCFDIKTQIENGHVLLLNCLNIVLVK